MDNTDWDWNGIRYFAALVEHETLTAAAARLNVQHSTVARQIAQLETALGLHLFDRIGKRYLLTADGEQLYNHARELCKDMDVLRRVARGQTQARHTVTVSVPPVIARLLLMPHLAEFHRRCPNICLHVQSEPLLTDLHRRQADIALRIGRPTQPDLAARRLFDFTYRPYAHRDYLRRVARENWRFVQSTVEAAHSRWFAEQIGAQADIVFASNDFAAVKQAIAAQLGIGLLPDFSVSPDDGLTIAALAPDGSVPILEAQLYLVMHEDVRRSPSVRATADFMVEMLAGDKETV